MQDSRLEIVNRPEGNEKVAFTDIEEEIIDF